MGWASLIEDVVKRFDAEQLWSFPSPTSRKGPSAEDEKERLRLDCEKLATKIAVQEFQRNEKKLKRLEAEGARLEQDLVEASRGLDNLKRKLDQAVKENEKLDVRLGAYREKFVHRMSQVAVSESTRGSDSIDSLLGKIKQFQSRELSNFGSGVRERFDAIANYALSKKRTESQALKNELLKRKIADTKLEFEHLEEFFEQVEKHRRALSDATRSCEGWEMMDEWLKNNKVISPKEENDPPIPKKVKKAESRTFNPVFKGEINFHG